MEPFKQNLTKISYQHSQTIYDVLQKEIENLESVQGVNFEFIDSLKNNGIINLLTFDNSSEKICNSKALVDSDTAGRRHGVQLVSSKQTWARR